MKEGTIVQVIGPVVDIEFSGTTPPDISNAVEIPRTSLEGVNENLIVEVQQQLGEDRVRCVAMDSTDGLVRGMKAIDTGGPIKVPVGPAVLGRLINVIGAGIDGLGPVEAKTKNSIHRPPPSFMELSTKKELFETSIKVIDLLEPYP